ncbi:major capsid protein [bacterium]|nr:major capsid protein [bacterium]
MGLSGIRIVDPVLTEYATGYRNEEFIAGKVFPEVYVKKEGGIIPKFTKEIFKIYDTFRAPGANSNLYRMDDLNTVEFVLQEHDLAIPIDRREFSEADYDLQFQAVEDGLNAIDLKLEKEVADICQNADNYAASHKKALATTTCWSESTGDPIADIAAAREVIRQDTGRYPNTLVLGASTFATLENNSKILDRIKYTQLGVTTEELLSKVFKVDTVIVGKAVYDNGTTQADVWGDVAILAHVARESRSFRTPNAGYILRKEGYKQVDKYETEGGKIINIRTTDIRTAKIVGADAMYLISNTVK